MAEEARRRNGKGTGKEGSEGSHPFKGKGKSPGKAQQKGGKGKSGPGGSPAAPSAVRLDLLLEAAYQLYIAGRRADQPRVSRNAWLRTPPLERSSESACGQLTTRPGLAPSRPQLRRVSRSRPLPVNRLLPRGPGPGTPTARGKRRPPQPPALTPPLQFLLLRRRSSRPPPRPVPMVQKDGEENYQCQKRGQRTALRKSAGGAGILGARGYGGGLRFPSLPGAQRMGLARANEGGSGGHSSGRLFHGFHGDGTPAGL